MRPLRYREMGGYYEVTFYGRYIGTVRKVTGKWVATLPNGSEPPTFFGTRRTAAEWLSRVRRVDVGSAA
jgi:hypothetical protein